MLPCSAKCVGCSVRTTFPTRKLLFHDVESKFVCNFWSGQGGLIRCCNFMSSLQVMMRVITTVTMIIMMVMMMIMMMIRDDIKDDDDE